MRTLKWLLVIIVCALFLYAESNNEKAMELLKKGNDLFQVYKDPSQAFTYFMQAAALASGYIKVEALLQAAYMSHLQGNKIPAYQNIIKEALNIDPEKRLEPIDYRDSFIQIFNDIKNRETTTIMPIITNPATKSTAIQPQSKKPASPPNRSRPVETNKFKHFSLRGSYFMGFTTETLTSNFTPAIYREQASFVTAYEAKKGNTIDAALGFKFSPVFSVEVGGSIASRDVAATITTAVPHPLLFDNPRNGTGSAGYELKETDLYLNLMYTLKMNILAIDLFAGPCYFMSETTIVTGYAWTDAYPYTQVNVTYSSQIVKKNVIGFNAGIAAGYYFGNTVGLVASARFISAKAKFATATDVPDVEYKPGGFQTGVGLKIKF